MSARDDVKNRLGLTDDEVDEVIASLLEEGLMEARQFGGRTYYAITPKGAAALPAMDADIQALKATLASCNSGGSEMSN